MTGASVVSMAAQLVRGKLAALLLGPAGVGVFNQLSVMWNIFNVAGGLGSFLGVVQHGAEALENDDQVALRRLSSTFILLLGLVSCLLALLGVLLSSRISNWLLHDGGQHAPLVTLILLSVPLAVAAQTYHALLSAARAVGVLVRIQIFTDVGAAAIFAILIFPLGLTGAVVGFMATYVIMLIGKAIAVRRLMGRENFRPRIRDFSWAVVRGNIGFGASGLIMITLANVSLLMVSRLVIDHLGIEANGIFANAWRIASVYLGAVTAATQSYYLPTLTRCATTDEMAREVNATLRFYLFALPLVMAAIMAGGDTLVWLILSKDFLPVAPLLLIFVPAELIRVVGELTSFPLMARRRMTAFTALYVLQAVVFIAAAALLIPRMGLFGAALAYATGVSVGAIASFLASWRILGIHFERATVAGLARAALLLGGVALSSWLFPLGLARIGTTALLCALWLVWVMRDKGARVMLRNNVERFRRQFVGTSEA